MSRLAEFRELEAQLAALRAELDVLKNDPNVLNKIAFEEKLRALLSEYSYSLPEVINTSELHANSPSKDPATNDGTPLGGDELPELSWNLPNEIFS